MLFSIDATRWRTWSDHFEDRFNDADSEFRKVVVRGAQNVKLDWTAQWSPSRHLPYIGSSVTVDVTGGSGVYAAEIGPEKGLGRQGSLGHLIEDANGAARNRATHAGARAGRREEPRFARAAGDAAVEGVGG